MKDEVITRIINKKLIVIVRGADEQKILPLAEALVKGGIEMIEITFNQRNPESFSSTARSIEAIRKHFNGDVCTGAGTVLTIEQLNMAKDAGAMYIISPNTDAKIIAKTVELGLVSIPGAMTPSECMTAHNAGADIIKLFPLGDLGLGYFKSLKAPLSHLHFLGTGGINEKNIPDFLSAGIDGFGVGGNLVDKNLLNNNDFGKITETAIRYVKTILNFYEGD